MDEPVEALFNPEDFPPKRMEVLTAARITAFNAG
jgi:hypothetical protein